MKKNCFIYGCDAKFFDTAENHPSREVSPLSRPFLHLSFRPCLILSDSSAFLCLPPTERNPCSLLTLFLFWHTDTSRDGKSDFPSHACQQVRHVQFPGLPLPRQETQRNIWPRGQCFLLLPGGSTQALGVCVGEQPPSLSPIHFKHLFPFHAHKLLCPLVAKTAPARRDGF